MHLITCNVVNFVITVNRIPWLPRSPKVYASLYQRDNENHANHNWYGANYAKGHRNPWVSNAERCEYKIKSARMGATVWKQNNWLTTNKLFPDYSSHEQPCHGQRHSVLPPAHWVPAWALAARPWWHQVQVSLRLPALWLWTPHVCREAFRWTGDRDHRC